MIPNRKQGQTHKQYINTLMSEIKRLHTIIDDKNIVIKELTENEPVEKRTPLINALKDRAKLINMLKNYGLWCGYIEG